MSQHEISSKKCSSLIIKCIMYVSGVVILILVSSIMISSIREDLNCDEQRKNKQQSVSVTVIVSNHQKPSRIWQWHASKNTR